MLITEFFDITNLDHLKAYQHLSDTGSWPEGFVPKGTEFQPGWHIILVGNMAARS